jgi:putative effector of murein hydrolase
MNQKQIEDMQAFISKHSFAVAYQNTPYTDYDEESRIIKFLLGRVVLMRELPLMQATYQLTLQHVQSQINS